MFYVGAFALLFMCIECFVEHAINVSVTVLCFVLLSQLLYHLLLTLMVKWLSLFLLIIVLLCSALCMWAFVCAHGLALLCALVNGCYESVFTVYVILYAFIRSPTPKKSKSIILPKQNIKRSSYPHTHGCNCPLARNISCLSAFITSRAHLRY